MTSLDHLWAGWRSEYLRRPEPPPGKDGCVFCSLLADPERDVENHVLWRHPDGSAAAVINAFPYTSGHLMVMPVRHVGALEDLDGPEGAAVWAGVVDAVVALKAAYVPDGLNMGANLGRPAGAGIPAHVHVHVLPRWNGDTNFMTPVADTRVLPEPLAESASKVRDAWPKP